VETADYMRFTVEEVNAGQAAGWSFVAGWFRFSQSYWAWFKRDDHG